MSSSDLPLAILLYPNDDESSWAPVFNGTSVFRKYNPDELHYPEWACGNPVPTLQGSEDDVRLDELLGACKLLVESASPGGFPGFRVVDLSSLQNLNRLLIKMGVCDVSPI